MSARRVAPARPSALGLAAAVAIAVCVGPGVAVADFTGKVVGVTDGDTITVMHAGRGERIRLYGIDTPERKQPFATKATEMTSKLAFGREVVVVTRGRDRYKRTIGEIFLPDGRSLNQELVRAGMAWWFRRYAPADGTLEQLERDAREARRGLWADADPTPPWEYRRRKSDDPAIPVNRQPLKKATWACQVAPDPVALERLALT